MFIVGLRGFYARPEEVLPSFNESGSKRTWLLARMFAMLDQGPIAGTQEAHQNADMSNLIVVGFDQAADAFEMRAALAKLQAKYLIEMEDAVVVTRNAKGKVQLHQAANLTAAGAAGGMFWGMLIGMLFLNPLLGAAIGAGSGALSGKLTDIGISDQFMKDLGAALAAESAALFVLVRKSTPDKVLEELKPFAGKGRILQTSLTKDKEEELRAFIEGQMAVA
jgi:uncharacterized membrane protein